MSYLLSPVPISLLTIAKTFYQQKKGQNLTSLIPKFTGREPQSSIRHRLHHWDRLVFPYPIVYQKFITDSRDKHGMILQGDALTMLRTLPAESINMVITSPPYWRRRDYCVAGQLGLELSYDEYITNLCDVFDEVKRVLRSDGTCWVNLEDSYSSSSGGYPSPLHTKARRFGYTIPPTPRTSTPRRSLCLIPYRFATEMVRRGWLLRNTIIWHKPNGLPESV